MVIEEIECTETCLYNYRPHSGYLLTDTYWNTYVKINF